MVSARMKPFFKVGVNDAGGGWRLDAVDGPGPRLLRPYGEIGDEVEQLISGADQPVEPGFLKAQRVEKLRALLARQRCNLRFDLGGDGHGNRALFFGLFCNHLGKAVTFGGGGFLDVADVKHRLAQFQCVISCRRKNKSSKIRMLASTA